MTFFKSIAAVKPRSEPNGVAYAPQRDMAYNFAPLATEVFTLLDSKNWSPQVRKVLEGVAATDEEIDVKLGEGVKCFTEALSMFIRTPEIKTIDEALDKSGFDELDARVQIVLMSGFGSSMVAAYFFCLRDNTARGEPTATHLDWITMLAAADRAASRLLQKELAKPDTPKNALESFEALQAQANEFEKILAQKADTQAELQAQLVEVSKKLMDSEVIVDMCRRFLPYIQKLVSSPTFWQKCQQGICLLIKAITFR